MPVFVTTFTYKSGRAAAAMVTRTEESDDLRHAIRKAEQALEHQQITPLSHDGVEGQPIASAEVIAVKVAAPAPSRTNIQDRPDVQAVAESVRAYNNLGRRRRGSF